MSTYGPSVDIFDPLFGATTGDSETAPQMAMIALGTVANTVDAFPGFGFDFDGQVGQALDSTGLAHLPLEVEAGLLAEPALTSAKATITSATETGGGGISLVMAVRIQGADGDAIGFSVASGG